MDDLYALDPEDFVAARDARVRVLRQEGRRAEAAELAALRRPSVAAWVVNRLARDRPDDVAALLAAGSALRAAQRSAVAGEPAAAAALREATGARREALGRLTRLAAELLSATGRGGAHLDAVTGTLEAATVDESVAESVRSGRLDRERTAAGVGFGFAALGDVAPPPRVPASRAAPAPRAAPGSRAAPAPRAAAPRPAPAPRSRDQVTPVGDEPTDVTRSQSGKDDAAAELRDELAAAERAAATLAEAAGEAERAAAALREQAAAAAKQARDRRTAARKAELAADRLRQRLWELGERDR